MRFALLLFILVPIVEMTVLIQVGSEIGSLPTIAMVFLTAIVGVGLIRKQGLETSQKAQMKIQQGQLPAAEMAEGVMLLFAGLCLLIPGFVTDALGALFLVPPLRKLFAVGVVVKLLSRVMPKGRSWQAGGRQQGDVFEGEFVKEEQDYIDKK
ncbi:FxsA family protein [Marinomonas epiphytica]